MMKINKISNFKPQPIVSQMFQGKVETQFLLDEKPGGIRVRITSFSAGARNLLHSHTSQQVLFALEGRGIVATENDEFILEPGMVAYISPHEKHWHGATATSAFSHIAISGPGETIFPV